MLSIQVPTNYKYKPSTTPCSSSSSSSSSSNPNDNFERFSVFSFSLFFRFLSFSLKICTLMIFKLLSLLYWINMSLMSIVSLVYISLLLPPFKPATFLKWVISPTNSVCHSLPTPPIYFTILYFNNYSGLEKWKWKI